MVKYRKQSRKINGVIESTDPLYRWLVWLDKGSSPELLAEVMKMDTAIQSANERMVYVTGDKESIRAYWRHQMDLSDRTSELNFARDEGRAEAREELREEVREEVCTEVHAEGRAKGRNEVIDLLEQGLSLDEIKQRLAKK